MILLFFAIAIARCIYHLVGGGNPINVAVFSSDHWGGWIGGFGPFFQNAHFVYVINIVKTLWVRKITMF